MLRLLMYKHGLQQVIFRYSVLFFHTFQTKRNWATKQILQRNTGKALE